MGRAMAFLIVEDVQVNEQMLASGWARYHSDATSQTAKLKEVSRQAKDGKKGIYSELCLQTKNADNPKCIIKGNLKIKGLRDANYIIFPIARSISLYKLKKIWANSGFAQRRKQARQDI